MCNTNLWIIDEIVSLLSELKESKEYFTSNKDFTRKRVFTFETLFFLISDLPRKSLGVELEESLEKINELLGAKKNGSKSGFGKARMKIKPELFRAVNDKVIDLFYGIKNNKNQKRWKGFILMAIDGSILDMVDLPWVREKFGVQENQYGGTVQGRMMIGYDVLNGLIRHQNLGSLKKGEGSVVKDWIEKMAKDELCIYDRLYPGVSLQYLHQERGIHYVMRCKTGFNGCIKAFMDSGKKETTEEWLLTNKAIASLKKRGFNVNNKTTIPVRIIRVELDDGEVEVLITNLLDKKKYPYKIFKALYFKRWGVETKIGYLKNTLQIELASGRSIVSIYQDFYATIFRSNVQSLIEQDCENRVEKISKKRKYNYQVNHAVAAGNLKRKLARLFLAENRQEVYGKLVDVFIKHIEPIRPKRNVPRPKGAQKINGKYRPMTNYKKIA